MIELTLINNYCRLGNMSALKTVCPLSLAYAPEAKHSDQDRQHDKCAQDGSSVGPHGICASSGYSRFETNLGTPHVQSNTMMQLLNYFILFR